MKKKGLPLPLSTSKEQLANEFNEFFVDEIKTICVNIEAGLDQETNPYARDTVTDKLMESFCIMSTSEIMEIIKKITREKLQK